jgi:hypothetical protein
LGDFAKGGKEMSWQNHSKSMEDKMGQAIVEMRMAGILDKGNNKEFDGQPIVSEDLVGNFINELNYEQQHELQWRWLRNEAVEAKYRDDMLKAMMLTIVKMSGSVEVNEDGSDGNYSEQLHYYVWVISLIKPFDRVLFLEDGR